MATTVDVLQYVLGMDLKGLQAGAVQSDQIVSRMATSIRNTLMGLAGAFGVAFSMRAVIDFTKGLVSAYSESEVIMTRLKKAVELTGASYEQARMPIERFLFQIQKTTTFTDEQAAVTLQRLTQLTGSLSKGFEGTSLALAMAKGGFVDIETASRMISIAMSGQVGRLGMLVPALRAHSKEIMANADAGQRWLLIKKALTETFGADIRAADTYSASMQQLQNWIQEVKERMGQVIALKLAPTIREWKDAIVEFTETGKLGKWLEVFSSGINGIAFLVSRTFTFMLELEKIMFDPDRVEKWTTAMILHPKKFIASMSADIVKVKELWDRFQEDLARPPSGGFIGPMPLPAGKGIGEIVEESDKKQKESADWLSEAKKELWKEDADESKRIQDEMAGYVFEVGSQELTNRTDLEEQALLASQDYLEAYRNKATEIFSGVGDFFGNVFRGMFDNTKSFHDNVKSAFTNLGNFIINLLAKWLSSYITNMLVELGIFRSTERAKTAILAEELAKRKAMVSTSGEGGGGGWGWLSTIAGIGSMFLQGGGFVRKYGIAEQGEYVMPVPAVAGIGAENLEYMRRTGKMPGGITINMGGFSFSGMKKADAYFAEDRFRSAVVEAVKQARDRREMD